MKSISLSFTVLLAALFTTSIAQQASSPANCTVFSPSPNNTYLRYSLHATRISSAQSCPSRANTTQSCALTASGDFLVSFSTNVSTLLSDSSWNVDKTPQSFLNNLIRGTLGADGANFNLSVVGVIDTVVPLTPGSAGYLNFFLLLRCVAGSMSGCTGAIDDGLPIEACAPVASVVQSVRRLEGRTEVVNVNASDVGGYPDPFENQSRSAGVGGVSASVRGISFNWVLCGVLVGAGLVAVELV
jgi:hypothetical protein